MIIRSSHKVQKTLVVSFMTATLLPAPCSSSTDTLKSKVEMSKKLLIKPDEPQIMLNRDFLEFPGLSLQPRSQAKTSLLLGKTSMLPCCGAGLTKQHGQLSAMILKLEFYLLNILEVNKNHIYISGISQFVLLSPVPSLPAWKLLPAFQEVLGLKKEGLSRINKNCGSQQVCSYPVAA